MKKIYKLFALIFVSIFVKAQVPTATIVAPTTTACTGTSITFTSLTANTPTVLSWTIIPNLGLTIFPDFNSAIIAVTFINPGTYIVSLIVANASGSSTVTQNITVAKTATASFNATLLDVGYPSQLNLTNFSSNAIAYNWLFSDVAAIDNNTNTVKSYTSSGSYSLALISFGSLGCNDTLNYSFRISDSSSITLPNVFTPNNDSVNDVFKPKIRGIKELNLWIYNRYGVIIYSNNKINSFWDGYTTSGEPCAAGVYFCVAEAVGFDGKSYKLQRNITLLR